MVNKKETRPLLGYRQSKKQSKKKTWCLYGGLFLLVISITIILIIVWSQSGNIILKISNINRSSKLFSHAAVATDSPQCSKVGGDVLRRGGSAVDSAVAVAFCSELFNPHSTGIGGGSFILIYQKPRNGSRRIFRSINARETAPNAADENKLQESKLGKYTVGVPGMVKGLYQAWLEFGVLPWHSLFEPSINLCFSGIPVRKHLSDAIQLLVKKNQLLENKNLKSLLTKDGRVPLKEGDLMKRPNLGRTLQKIAKNGENAFYKNASLFDDILEDLREANVPLVKRDFSNYDVIKGGSISTRIEAKNLTLHGVPGITGSPILINMLNILNGFNTDVQNVSSVFRAVETRHKMVEAMKFAYASRTYLGDPAFVNITQIMEKILSKEFASISSSQITYRTHEPGYYSPVSSVVPDDGTSHVSVYAADGGAVSLTGTINTYFGSLIMGRRTGIIFNSEMTDFTWRNSMINKSMNRIEPGKRPLSSMCPSILLNDNGEVSMVIGASGGSKIPTGILNVLYNLLFFNMTLEESVAAQRLHHNLIHNVLRYEENYDPVILAGLKQRGHVLKPSALSVVSTIFDPCAKLRNRGQLYPRCIQATSDPRKNGSPDGY